MTDGRIDWGSPHAEPYDVPPDPEPSVVGEREPTWEDCICIHGTVVDPGCPYCNRHETPE